MSRADRLWAALQFSPPPVPTLALHLRTGDLRERVGPLEPRLRVAVDQVKEWGLDVAMLHIYIATDSDDAEEVAHMRAAFPTAQIGLPERLRSELAPASDPSVLSSVLLDKAMCVRGSADLLLLDR